MVEGKYFHKRCPYCAWPRTDITFTTESKDLLAPMPAPEPAPTAEPSVRRSSRSTKGQHSRFQVVEEPEKPARAATTKQSAKRARKPLAAAAAANDELVNCPCNTYSEDDARMMLQCEKCLAWQHVACVFGVEDETVVPEVYICSACTAKAGKKTKREKTVKETKPALDKELRKKRRKVSLMVFLF